MPTSNNNTLSPQSTTPVTIARRRSSIYNSLQEVLTAGGRNSISQFASSYSRSANFITADFDYNSHPTRPIIAGSPGETNALIDEDSPSTYTGLDQDVIGNEESSSDVRSIREEVLFKTGNSTAPQTIFNGINTLIGIGILTLPLGLSYAGWVFGAIILMSCAIASQCTARILAKCLQKGGAEMKTYGDIAQFAFGKVAYVIVVMTFTIDLLFAGVSMIILFADSFNVLTGIGKFYFKCGISISFFLLSFVRLSLLSHLSLVGILCTSMIVVVVCVCGFIKQTTPGSLIQVAPTSLWPADLEHLLLSLGIFMSPFGGHAIFPELYRDMKHPYKYPAACSVIFAFTWLVDFIMASLGYLMFGNDITDQATKSIMMTSGYPRWVSYVICALMGLLPISKGPLITRPIITMIDQLTVDNSIRAKKSNTRDSVMKFINRFAVTMVFFITSLIFTDFGRIMSFLGSAICFSICLVYPLSFYLKLFYHELSIQYKILVSIGIAIAFSCAVFGTVAVVIA